MFRQQDNSINLMFKILLLVHSVSVISKVCNYSGGGGEHSLRKIVVLAIPSISTQDTGYINMKSKYSETNNKAKCY